MTNVIYGTRYKKEQIFLEILKNVQKSDGEKQGGVAGRGGVAGIISPDLNFLKPYRLSSYDF